MSKVDSSLMSKQVALIVSKPLKGVKNLCINYIPLPYILDRRHNINVFEEAVEGNILA
jgi:hypothetical protein